MSKTKLHAVAGSAIELNIPTVERLLLVAEASGQLVELVDAMRRMFNNSDERATFLDLLLCRMEVLTVAIADLGHVNEDDDQVAAELRSIVTVDVSKGYYERRCQTSPLEAR